MIKSKNRDLLLSFTKYCEENPELRFWQALRNWSTWAFILASNGSERTQDTFYWRRKNG